MTPDPIWLSVARAFTGLTEHRGPGSNPVIPRWARDIGAPPWYADDDQPWCALFANRVLAACGLPMSGEGFDLLRAKAFETWGQPMTLGPAPGAVLVFARAGGGHVGFYVGERGDAFRVLGGNQSDAVGETWIAKDRLTAMRWPAGVPVPYVQRIHLNDHAPTSTNEQ